MLTQETCITGKEEDMMHKVLSNIRKNGWMALLLMSALLWSCSDNSDYDSETQGDELWVRGIKSYAANDIDDDTTIRIFLSSIEEIIDGSVQKVNDNNWRSTIRVNKDTQYYIYGYMPMESVNSASVTPLPAGIAKGVVLKLNGVEAVTPSDICVIIGVQDLENRTDAFNVKKGIFSYIGKDRGKNYANLLLDHLQASIHFELLIDNSYSQLRTIKVRKAEILAGTGSRYNMTITLEANTADVSPIKTISYEPTAGETNAEVFTDDEGCALSPTVPLEFDANYLTLMRSMLSLKTTYDVYDSKGKFIHTRTSINKLDTAIPETLARGGRTTLTLTVKPTYLYVLADPDLNNPTLKIEN